MTKIEPGVVKRITLLDSTELGRAYQFLKRTLDVRVFQDNDVDLFIDGSSTAMAELILSREHIEYAISDLEPNMAATASHAFTGQVTTTARLTDAHSDPKAQKQVWYELARYAKFADPLLVTGFLLVCISTGFWSVEFAVILFGIGCMVLGYLLSRTI